MYVRVQIHVFTCRLYVVLYADYYGKSHNPGIQYLLTPWTIFLCGQLKLPV